MSNHTGGTNGGTVRYSVPQAARYLGISERAVRKRIDAGTLAAERDGRQWVVFLVAVPDAVPSGTSSDGEAVPGGTSGGTDAEPIEAHYRVTPDEIEQAIERTGDKYVADFAIMFNRLDDLYRDWLADKDRLISELQQQRDTLQRRDRELEAQQVEAPASVVETPETATDAATGRSRKPRQRRRR